jgi:hypothetical protein
MEDVVIPKLGTDKGKEITMEQVITPRCLKKLYHGEINQPLILSKRLYTYKLLPIT